MREYKRKKNFINNKNINNYVCPWCFNQIEDCTCDMASYTLIMVDNKLQKAVRELNQKKYFTVDCCEGHFYNPVPNTYISFVRPVKLSNVPKGFKYEKDGNVIRKIYHVQTEEEFEAEQKIAIQDIENWVENLKER